MHAGFPECHRYLLSIEEDSSATRVMVGFDAGKSELSTLVEGCQETAHGRRKLTSGTVEAGGNKSPRMILGVATSYSISY
jgi:hypothetical protein